MSRGGAESGAYLAALGKTSQLLLGEDELAVAQDVELPLAARDRRRVDPLRGELGRETRGPAVVPASGGAVVDLDAHRAVTLALACATIASRPATRRAALATESSTSCSQNASSHSQTNSRMYVLSSPPAHRRDRKPRHCARICSLASRSRA